jgi:hypothetical protein
MMNVTILGYIKGDVNLNDVHSFLCLSQHEELDAVLAVGSDFHGNGWCAEGAIPGHIVNIDCIYHRHSHNHFNADDLLPDKLWANYSLQEAARNWGAQLYCEKRCWSDFPNWNFSASLHLMICKFDLFIIVLFNRIEPSRPAQMLPPTRNQNRTPAVQSSKDMVEVRNLYNSHLKNLWLNSLYWTIIGENRWSE